MRKRKPVQDHPELLGLPEVRMLWQTEGLFSDHYLKAHLRKNAWWPGDNEARRVWEFCQQLYEKRYLACARNNEAFTRQELIDKILEKLDFPYTVNLGLPETEQDLEPDYILYPDADSKERVIDKSAADRYRAAVAILEAKKLNHPLSKISKHQQRYAHQQIRDYLNEAQVLNWGILTNGNEWRLYCRDDKPSHYFALNFEVALKSPEDFKFFLALFSPAAFERAAQGKCRLDQIRESALAAQSKLEEDLRQRIFAIVEILANGFAERPENKISDAGLPRLYQNCLIFLYRLLFILYAEGRSLLPVEPKSRKYFKELSLARLISSLKNFSEFDSRTRTRLYQDIQELCHLINGTDEKKNAEYKVPRYNGGLFDPARHPDLEQWSVCDAVLADVLRGLLFNPLPDSQQPALPVDTVDFGDLRVQQLGSIYEGLLEHHFVRENNRLALKTDRAERKATGTYYTPDYIVKYIVEQTVTPLVAEIENRDPVKSARVAGRQDNTFANEVLKLNICDPAMGSGHFLVEATTFLADQIVYHPTTKFQAGYSRGQSQEEAEIAFWRRRVVEGCIYGVDLNPLAVELAKLSLWLTTIATDQPLNFLDHHLCCGNSLIGARLEELSHVPDKQRKKAGDLKLVWEISENLRAALTRAVQKVHSIEGATSATVSDVKNKEKLWLESVRPALLPFRTLANLLTACFFGNDLAQKDYEALIELLDIHPDRIRPWQDATEFKAIAMEAVKKGSLKLAGREFDINQLKNLCAFLFRSERCAAQRRFFHWELEFPEVFFNEDGTPRQRPGFDAVIGNPPWGAVLSAEEKEFYRILETDTSTPNSYIYFIRQAELMTRTGGSDGFVLPDSILVKDYAKTRRALLQDNTLARVAYLARAFTGVNHDSAIIIFRRGKVIGISLAVGIVPQGAIAIEPFLVSIRGDVFDNKELEYRFNLNLKDPQNQEAYLRLCSLPKISEVGEFHEGIHSGNIREKLFYNSKPKFRPASKLKPCLIGATYGDQFGRYFCVPNGNWTIYDPSLIRKENGEYASLRDENIFVGPKLYVTRTGDNFFSFFDESHYASINLFSFKFKAKEPALSYWFVLAVLNSAFAQRFNRLFLAPRFGDLFTETKILHLELLPIPDLKFNTPEKSRVARLAQAKQVYERTQADGKKEGVLHFVAEELAAKPAGADVVHDLLAFLAERMTSLNREKRAAAKQFLTDLKEFHGIDGRELNPKTKLDEFWKLETNELFAHLRKNSKTLGARNVRLKDTDEEKIRARFQKAKDTLLPLETQLTFTDRLIDQVVYQLYGLTEQEIRLLEEKLKA